MQNQFALPPAVSKSVQPVEHEHNNNPDIVVKVIIKNSDTSLF